MGYQKWQDVFTSSKNCCFDEWAGHCGECISMIIRASGIQVYDGCDFADLNVNKGWFLPNGKIYIGKKIYFRIGSDGCFAYNNKDLVHEAA